MENPYSQQNEENEYEEEEPTHTMKMLLDENLEEFRKPVTFVEPIHAWIRKTAY